MSSEDQKALDLVIREIEIGRDISRSHLDMLRDPNEIQRKMDLCYGYDLTLSILESHRVAQDVNPELVDQLDTAQANLASLRREKEALRTELERIRRLYAQEAEKRREMAQELKRATV